MPLTLSLDRAATRLREIVENMVPGEQPVLISGGETMAVVTRPSPAHWPCQPGSAKETKHWMPSDFDAPLDDFRE